jgi:hypothetical protein
VGWRRLWLLLLLLPLLWLIVWWADCHPNVFVLLLLLQLLLVLVVVGEGVESSPVSKDEGASDGAGVDQVGSM